MNSLGSSTYSSAASSSSSTSSVSSSSLSSESSGSASCTTSTATSPAAQGHQHTSHQQTERDRNNAATQNHGQLEMVRSEELGKTAQIIEHRTPSSVTSATVNGSADPAIKQSALSTRSTDAVTATNGPKDAKAKCDENIDTELSNQYRHNVSDYARSITAQQRYIALSAATRMNGTFYGSNGSINENNYNNRPVSLNSWKTFNSKRDKRKKKTEKKILAGEIPGNIGTRPVEELVNLIESGTNGASNHNNRNTRQKAQQNQYQQTNIHNSTNHSSNIKRNDNQTGNHNTSSSSDSSSSSGSSSVSSEDSIASTVDSAGSISNINNIANSRYQQSSKMTNNHNSQSHKNSSQAHIAATNNHQTASATTTPSSAPHQDHAARDTRNTSKATTNNVKAVSQTPFNRSTQYKSQAQAKQPSKIQNTSQNVNKQQPQTQEASMRPQTATNNTSLQHKSRQQSQNKPPIVTFQTTRPLNQQGRLPNHPVARTYPHNQRSDASSQKQNVQPTNIPGFKKGSPPVIFADHICLSDENTNRYTFGFFEDQTKQLSALPTQTAGLDAGNADNIKSPAKSSTTRLTGDKKQDEEKIEKDKRENRRSETSPNSEKKTQTYVDKVNAKSFNYEQILKFISNAWETSKAQAKTQSTMIVSKT